MTITLPPHRTQTALNLRRWGKLFRNPQLAAPEGRIETDRHGRMVWTPPATARHALLQAEISILLQRLMCDGRGFIACPISTCDGVKVVDVAWASPARLCVLGIRECFPRAPEICVEVLLPEDSAAEIAERTKLLLDAFATEVWCCSPEGKMTFHGAIAASMPSRSRLCPNFPTTIRAR